MASGPPGHDRSLTDPVEEFLIALILGLMTLITFANVVVRYVFSSEWFEPVQVWLGLPTNLLWSLETTSFLFAWLVLLGISYAVRHNAHLGVDVVVGRLGHMGRKTLTLVAAACCILYAFLLLKGGWDYWANFANLPETSGRWFPTGLESDFRPQGWYEVNDIPMPSWLQWMGDYLNDGEEYEKIPRVIPYVVLPVSFLLLLLRFIQVTRRVYRDEQDLIITSHEGEEEVEQMRAEHEQRA